MDNQSLKKWSVKEDIIFAFWNCQCLKTAYPALCSILSDIQEKPLVIGLCETFMSNRDNFSFPVSRICQWKERTTGYGARRSGFVDKGMSFLMGEEGSSCCDLKEGLTLITEIEDKSG